MAYFRRPCAILCTTVSGQVATEKIERTDLADRQLVSVLFVGQMVIVPIDAPSVD
jgi:hypothetical protein